MKAGPFFCAMPAMDLQLGINQKLILRALRSLEAKHGHHSKFTTRQLIDAIWFEVELLSNHELASELDPRLAARLREIRAAHGRVLAVKRRGGRKFKSNRTWNLAVETLNPASSLRRLIARGLVERAGGKMWLTEPGRVQNLPEPLHSAAE
jgi:hypothetical protein